MINLSSLPGFKKGGNDSKFFTTTKKGEIYDLKLELNNQKLERRKDAVKKVIAMMTVGKDVSMLFPDVLNCMQTGIVELKKLVYLYLINYAKTNPEMAILAVNTFRRDASDPNPLIRALSIRTMGCIRVEKITEYLCEPLRRALKDDDPYVRKTASICVAKLYDISPTMAVEQGFLKLLNELLTDSNPTVVANAVASLHEISERSNWKVFSVNNIVLPKLLAALGECAEWGQVFILDAVATYRPKSNRETESIIERVAPRLQHSNSAVVMGTVKIIINFLDILEDPETVKALCRKMSPPLVTLLSAEPEIQYIALRNINLIVKKQPTVLAGEIRVFFCRYNDPIYVKMEKLELLVLLCNERNADSVLLELKEYAIEVDVEFVRKSIRTIGRLAIKLGQITERCINVLLNLINTRVNYVVQESIVVIKDIFRRYPNRYESIISALCENLQSLDEPEARASMVWILGEYSNRIDNADELLESFVDSFTDESSDVQHQLLTATVKLYLKKPESSKELMENVLSLATEHSDNADLRDRGYIYWRLLSTDPEAAKRIVLGTKPVINDDSTIFSESFLDELVKNISTLASVYHQLPDKFVINDVNSIAVPEDNYSDLDEEDEAISSSDEEIRSSSENVEDLLDFNGSELNSSGNIIPDLFQDSHTGNNTVDSAIEKSSMNLLMENNILRIDGLLECVNGGSRAVLYLNFTNRSSDTLQEFKIQFNKNVFGLVPAIVSINLERPLSLGDQAGASVPLKFDNSKVTPTNITCIDVALKIMTTGSVEYFKLSTNFMALLSQKGKVNKKKFIEDWQALGNDIAIYSISSALRGIFSNEVDEVSAKLEQFNISKIATRTINDKNIVYFSCLPASCAQIFLEFTFKEGFDVCKVTIRCKQHSILQVALQSIEKIMCR